MAALKKIFPFFLTLILFFGPQKLFSQGKFYFPQENREKDKLKFEFVKNLMVIPVVLNGVELSFLLDTGVKNTILFSLEEKDSLVLKDAVSIKVRGLGQGESIKAFKSSNNSMKIGKALNDSLTLYMIFHRERNLSARLGIPVHGIIGTDFFRDFTVEVDYEKKFIKFYKPQTYDRKCKKYDVAKLYFFDENPYLIGDIKVSGKPLKTMLLMDSGLGTALWLYPNEEIHIPSKHFEDFLGFGLSGSIYGKKGKIESFSFGNHKFTDINTAFPDSTALSQDIKKTVLKDGIIGAGILRRFDLVIDYRNKLLYYRPNTFFDEPFYYNMSGISFQYEGVRVVKEYEYLNLGEFSTKNDVDVAHHIKPKAYKVQFRIEQAMVIAEIRPNSPAEKAGLEKGDVLLKLNGRKAHRYDLNKLSELFSSEEGKKIKIKVERAGIEFSTEFRLEKLF